MFFLDILVQSGTNILQKVPGAKYRCRLKTSFYWRTLFRDVLVGDKKSVFLG